MVVLNFVLLCCAENLLCTSLSCWFLCFVYERNGARRKIVIGFGHFVSSASDATECVDLWYIHVVGYEWEVYAIRCWRSSLFCVCKLALLKVAMIVE